MGKWASGERIETIEQDIREKDSGGLLAPGTNRTLMTLIGLIFAVATYVQVDSHPRGRILRYRVYAPQASRAMGPPTTVSQMSASSR
ncbi:MAG: hypothetical protein Fur0018_01470 [Anaerolineales bacterium]